MLQTASQPVRENSQRAVSFAKKRSLLVTLHLWLGLSLGALLVLIALSGSTMIFRYELERVFFPALTHSTATGIEDFNACLSSAQAVNPKKSVRTLRLPTNADGTLEWQTIPVGQTTKEQATTVYTDPHTCAVLGTRGPRKDVMSFLVNFHHGLLMGKNGAYLQTTVAVSAIFLAISGLIQWWPRNWTWSRVKPRAAARPLHYAIGFWAMWPLLCIATTSIYMSWRSEINKALLGEVKVAAAPKEAAATKAHDGATDMAKKPAAPSLNAIIATAQAAKPEATWRILTFPQKPKDPFTITYQLPGEYGRVGNNQISLKQNPDGTIRVTAVTELHAASPMKRFLTELMEIHYGEFGGLATRLLWCLTGFMPAILFFSGLLMWRQRLRNEAASQEIIAARLAR